MPVIPAIITTCVLLAPTGSLGVTNSSLDEKILEVKNAFHQPAKKSLAQLMQDGVLIIAQKYGGTDPAGDDPHGPDPHDETYDSKMPANRERNSNRAPRDVYGDQLPNNQQPY